MERFVYALIVVVIAAAASVPFVLWGGFSTYAVVMSIIFAIGTFLGLVIISALVVRIFVGRLPSHPVMDGMNHEDNDAHPNYSTDPTYSAWPTNWFYSEK